MKNKTLVYLLALGTCLSLSACGASSATSYSASSVVSASSSVVPAFDMTKKITVYTRDTTSGTRDGFFTKIGLGAAKTDNSKLVSTYVEVASNGAMVTSVKNDEYGIGYISLSSLSDSGLKGLNYDGIVPNEANVVAGSYELTRNFNYIIRNDYTAESKVGKIVAAFVAFLSTKEGKATMKASDGIVTFDGNEKSWSAIKADYPIASEDNSTVTVRFGGSTSVEKMARALTAQFAPLCGNFIASHNHTGSGDAYKHTQGSGKDDSGALDVGFLSRELELTSAEKAADNTYGKMATDAIVAVVSEDNPLSNATAAILKDIYDGTKTLWSEVVSA